MTSLKSGLRFLGVHVMAMRSRLVLCDLPNLVREKRAAGENLSGLYWCWVWRTAEREMGVTRESLGKLGFRRWLGSVPWSTLMARRGIGGKALGLESERGWVGSAYVDFVTDGSPSECVSCVVNESESEESVEEERSGDEKAGVVEDERRVEGVRRAKIGESARNVIATKRAIREIDDERSARVVVAVEVDTTSLEAETEGEKISRAQWSLRGVQLRLPALEVRERFG